MNRFENKPLEEKLKILRKEDQDLKTPWNKEIGVKALIIAPTLIYFLGLLFINNTNNPILIYFLLFLASAFIFILIKKTM